MWNALIYAAENGGVAIPEWFIKVEVLHAPAFCGQRQHEYC